LTLVGTVMDADPPTLPLDASLSQALALFESTGTWVLPVVDGTRFAGLLSKSTLFDHYGASCRCRRRTCEGCEGRLGGVVYVRGVVQTCPAVRSGPGRPWRDVRPPAGYRGKMPPYALSCSIGSRL